jgi:hypothetical protein
MGSCLSSVWAILHPKVKMGKLPLRLGNNLCVPVNPHPKTGLQSVEQGSGAGADFQNAQAWGNEEAVQPLQILVVVAVFLPPVVQGVGQRSRDVARSALDHKGRWAIRRQALASRRLSDDAPYLFG